MIAGLSMAGAGLVGKGINMFRNPYKGVRNELEQQYGLADLQGQRDFQSQLQRSNRTIGARLASVGAVDPMGYAGQAASDTMYRSLADLRAQLAGGKASALADLAYRSADFRNQAINDFLLSLGNAGQTAMLGGMMESPGAGQNMGRGYAEPMTSMDIMQYPSLSPFAGYDMNPEIPQFGSQPWYQGMQPSHPRWR